MFFAWRNNQLVVSLRVQRILIVQLGNVLFDKVLHQKSLRMKMINNL